MPIVGDEIRSRTVLTDANAVSVAALEGVAAAKRKGRYKIEFEIGEEFKREVVVDRIKFWLEENDLE